MPLYTIRTREQSEIEKLAYGEYEQSIGSTIQQHPTIAGEAIGAAGTIAGLMDLKRGKIGNVIQGAKNFVKRSITPAAKETGNIVQHAAEPVSVATAKREAAVAAARDQSGRQMMNSKVVPQNISKPASDIDTRISEAQARRTLAISNAQKQTMKPVAKPKTMNLIKKPTNTAITPAATPSVPIAAAVPISAHTPETISGMKNILSGGASNASYLRKNMPYSQVVRQSGFRGAY